MDILQCCAKAQKQKREVTVLQGAGTRFSRQPTRRRSSRALERRNCNKSPLGYDRTKIQIRRTSHSSKPLEAFHSTSLSESFCVCKHALSITYHDRSCCMQPAVDGIEQQRGALGSSKSSCDFPALFVRIYQFLEKSCERSEPTEGRDVPAAPRED